LQLVAGRLLFAEREEQLAGLEIVVGLVERLLEKAALHVLLRLLHRLRFRAGTSLHSLVQLLAGQADFIDQCFLVGLHDLLRRRLHGGKLAGAESRRLGGDIGGRAHRFRLAVGQFLEARGQLVSGLTLLIFLEDLAELQNDSGLAGVSIGRVDAGASCIGGVAGFLERGEDLVHFGAGKILQRGLGGHEHLSAVAGNSVGGHLVDQVLHLRHNCGGVGLHFLLVLLVR